LVNRDVVLAKSEARLEFCGVVLTKSGDRLANRGIALTNCGDVLAKRDTFLAFRSGIFIAGCRYKLLPNHKLQVTAPALGFHFPPAPQAPAGSTLNGRRAHRVHPFSSRIL